MSWVVIENDCAMRRTIDDCGQVTFVFGNGPDEFELAIDPVALHKLVGIGSAALAELAANPSVC
jgi:hypothetical protein